MSSYLDDLIRSEGAGVTDTSVCVVIVVVVIFAPIKCCFFFETLWFCATAWQRRREELVDALGNSFFVGDEDEFTVG